ncbi:MAG: Tn3 family transposase [Myxococcales bacterium]|nr:Tn3 family transposase [Myxococcales bacterium]
MVAVVLRGRPARLCREQLGFARGRRRREVVIRNWWRRRGGAAGSRQFSKRLLAQLEVGATDRDAPMLAAVETVKAAAETPGPLLTGAPTDFVPRRWRQFVLTSEGVDRRYYELCVLWRLRSALREGGAWVEHSRRFARLESYFVPGAEWRRIRGTMLPQLGVPGTPKRALRIKERSLEQLEAAAQHATESSHVQLEDGRVVIPAIQAEPQSRSLRELEAVVDARLPRVELGELLAEVDNWTRFSRHLEHGSERRPPRGHTLRHVLAAILAQGCNVGFTRMADIARLSFEQLAWASTWHLTDATIKKAFSAVVNHHNGLKLSATWGGGTLSSSDGQRFPVRGRVSGARALPRYFGYGRGVTFYTWTSDQYSQYGAKVIPSTSRDATYVLDEILDNETELDVLEHTTDTAGYTDLVFALFDLLGLRFAPRIRDSGATRLYRLDGTEPRWTHFMPAQTIKRTGIEKHWEEMLRVAASLKTGHVTASLLIARLQAQAGSGIARALVDYGRLCKTEHVLRYYATEEYRRRIGRQLNKGEALHALRRFLVFGNIARLGPKDTEALANQAACLNLATNAVISSNVM